MIIAWTANAIKGEELRCRDIGMDDYLSKPTLLTSLKAMLKTWQPALQSIDTATLSDVSINSATQGAVSKPLNVSVLEALVGNNPGMINETRA